MDYSKLFDLKGKVAIITGGANGIGKATAVLLAKAGADISIGDFNLEDAQKTAIEIQELGVKAIAVSCNVLKDGDLVNLVATTVKELGGIHILINNAGGTLILHGTSDETVPVSQSDNLKKKLDSLGIPNEYARLPLWPHTMDLDKRVNDYCQKKMNGFFEQNLK